MSQVDKTLTLRFRPEGVCFYCIGYLSCFGVIGYIVAYGLARRNNVFQDIFPHSIDMAYSANPPGEEDWLMVLRKGKVGLADGPEGKRLPKVGEVLAAETGERTIHLFSVDGKGVHLHFGDNGDDMGLEMADLMTFRGFSPEWLGFVGATACHLGAWYLANRFCGCCGGEMERKEDERALVCRRCAEVVFPRISPAVIVGVVDGDRIIMTKYANRPGSRLTALIAGFMEVGETFEDTVRREVMEEVGVEVKNIRYYKSQPWPFSGSVLAGFYADLAGTSDLIVDRGELAEARWMERGELPEDLGMLSLTAEMISMFRLGRERNWLPGILQVAMNRG